MLFGQTPPPGPTSSMTTVLASEMLAESPLTLPFHTPVLHATLDLCSVHYEGT